MCASSSLADAWAPDSSVQVRIASERAGDGAAVAALVERAFGPGRYAKVSERLREGNRRNAALSFCAFDQDRLVGTVGQWPIMVGPATGLFLGPIAVEGAWRRHGVGGLLIARCVKAASDAREAFILLVGDFALFSPYGFQRLASGGVTMPGPVDPSRILVWRGDDALEPLAGSVRVPAFP